MTAIAIIEAIATVLWTYAGLALMEWLAFVARAERRYHIPHTVDLLGNLVPAMLMLIVVVMAGAMIGLPSVVVLIAVLFPAGVAFGLHVSLNDLRDRASYRLELGRILSTFVVAAGVIYVRQFA